MKCLLAVIFLVVALLLQGLLLLMQDDTIKERDKKILELSKQIADAPTCREVTTEHCMNFWFNSEPTTIGREFRRLCGKRK